MTNAKNQKLRKNSMKTVNTLNALFFISLLIFVSILFSCKTLPAPEKETPHVSRKITDKGLLTEEQLADYFLSQNPNMERSDILRLATLYISEANFEGINSDVAFAQMCLETGYLKFGNLVLPEMHNYCGLGAIDAEHPGEWFETENDGVRAHIQHLHAYGTDESISLNGTLIDNRYKWVRPRGKAPTIWELAQTWAADPDYGKKLDAILERMQEVTDYQL